MLKSKKTILGIILCAIMTLSFSAAVTFAKPIKVYANDTESVYVEYKGRSKLEIKEDFSDLESIGLDDDWSFTGDKGGYGDYPYYYSDGVLYLKGNGTSQNNSVTVTALNGQSILSIALSFSNSTYNQAVVSVNGEEVTGDGDYRKMNYLFSGGCDSFTIARVSRDVKISSFTINYLLEEAPQKELVSLAILGAPTKTEYKVGETFNTDGLTVQATYSDASTGDVTDDAIFIINPETFTTASDNVSVILTAKVDDVFSSEKIINNIKVVEPEPTVIVSDILPEYLLTNSNNKWFNENGYSVAYVYGDYLYFQDEKSPSSIISTLLTTEVTKSGDNYTLNINGRTVTFTMNSNVLASIIVNSSFSDYLNGTYNLPPFMDSRTSFESTFNSSETTISLENGEITISSSNGEKVIELVLYVDSSFTKIPDGTYVFSDSQESGTALKCSGVSGDSLTKSYAAALIDGTIDKCWHIDSGIVTIAHNDETNFVITVDAENTNGCDVDITINACEEAPVEWTEWEKYESGTGVWKYSNEVLPKYLGGSDISSYFNVYIHSQKNNPDIKQLKLAGWGAQTLSTEGIDLIIDWNLSTKEFTIQKQNTGLFFSTYNEYVFIQDCNSYTNTTNYVNYYDEETKTFRFYVVYYISAGNLGYDYEEFKLIDTDIKANDYTYDADIKLIKLDADDVIYAFKLKEDIELGKTYVSSDMQYYCTLTPSGSLSMYGLDATLKVTENTFGEIHAEATMNVKGVTFNITYDEPHVHILKTTHNKVEATCEQAGCEEYFECVCGKYFSDEALTQEITNLEAWKAEEGDGYIAPKGHSKTKVPGVAATDTADGFKDAYKCNACGKYFEDADGTKLIGDETAYNAWKLAAGKIPALNPQDNKGLSGGAIVGIAVGSVVGVCLITYVAMFFVWKKNEKALKFLKPSFAWINKKIFRK